MAPLYRKLMSVLISSIILTGILLIPAFAVDAEDTVESFSSANKQIICVAHRGDWHSFPENSSEAVNAAKEYDMISIDLKLTSDSQIILMADKTVDRMCTDKDGNAVSGAVSSMSLEQIKELFLREGNGGKDKKRTDCRVATLEDAINAAGTGAALILNTEPSDFDVVYKRIKELGASNRVIFRFNKTKMSKILDIYNNSGKDVNFIGNYQGNIIFLATGAVKESFANSINTIELGSKNGHGVLYDNFLMKRFKGNGRAMVSMTGGRCGKRTDNETGWDDLISRGYSVIETDYPAELTDYIQRISSASTELERYADLYRGTDTSPYTSDTENAFKCALSNAENVINNSSSLSQISDARYSLQASYSNLTVGAKRAVTLAFGFTFGRIITAVLCAAALIISQIFLYKKRKKI